MVYFKYLWKNDLGISICFLTIYNGLISWLAREYGLYIYFGVNLNEVRERLLHCTQRWLCTAASRGEVAPLENTIKGLRVLVFKGWIVPRTRGQLWGTLVVLPASKEAESPSTHNPFHSILLLLQLTQLNSISIQSSVT